MPLLAERRDEGIPALATVTRFLVDGEGAWLGTLDRAGLWHSPGGDSWQPIEGFSGPTFALLRAGGARWAGTASGLWRDEGAGWQRVEDVPDTSVLGLAADGEIVYAAMGQEGLWRVAGGAAESLPLPSEVTALVGGVLGVAARGDWLLIGTSGGGVWQSRDGGAAWQKVPWDAQGYATDLVMAGEGEAWARARAGLWRTSDGGATWTQLDAPGPTALLVEAEQVFIGTGGRVLSSRDGTEWQEVGQGLNQQLPVVELGRDEQGRLVAGMQDGLWRLQDGTWQRDTRIGGVYVEALARLDDGTLLAGHRDGLYRSTDGGRSWQRESFGDGAAVVSLAADPHDPQGAWAGTDSAGVWRTRDGGARWHPIYERRTELDFVTGLYPDPAEEDHLWARVAYERFYEWREDGRGWRARWEGLDLVTQMFTLAFDPDEPGRLWAGSTDGLVTRTTSNPTWQRIAPELADQTVLALLPNTQEAEPLWIGATRGLYRSGDGGQSVEPTALRNLTVSALARADEQGGALLAGTKFYGLYLSPDGKAWSKVEALGNRTVTAIVPSPEGVWVATDDGLWLLNGLEGADSESDMSTATSMPPSTEDAGSQPRAEAGEFGVYAHLLNPSDELFRVASERGFEGVVVVFPWREIEPNPDEWHWEQTDLWVNAAQYYGLELVIRLDQSPQWAAEEGSASAQSLNPVPDDWNDFADFARREAERYRGKARGYVLWNEPNLALDWGGNAPDPAAYLEMLRLTAPVIRAADPTALVAAGALAPTTRDDAVAMDDLRYLDALLTGGAGEFFDVLAVHPYPFGLAPDAPASANGGLNLNRLQAVQALLEEHGLEGRALWATEFGYSIDPSGFGQPVSAGQRAAFLRDSLDYFPEAYPSVEMVAVWNLANGLEAGDEKAGYNLLGDPALSTLLPPRETRPEAPLAPVPAIALAGDVRVHLGDSELGPPWWPLFAGRMPSTRWQAGFYLREIPAEPQHLVLEIFQPNEFGNEARLNGTRLHHEPLPVTDFTAQWLTVQLPVAPSQLRVGWNEVEFRAGSLLPDFQQEAYVWDDLMLRNVRLEPAR